MQGSLLAITIQVSGLFLAPLLPGTIQTFKARFQGRRGSSPLQPYRELRRLWRKSLVAPNETTFVYQLAPSVAAAAVMCALLVLPISSGTVGWFGTDMIVIVGLLALARFVVTAAAWDPGSGFSLMGAGRDLMFSVYAEPLLLLALVLVALTAHSTDLVNMVAAASNPHVIQTPTHWAAALAFGLIVLVETGRQPIDNPDTHLELTMVHEGPLLEYAGRDLAMLQWTSAARHWIVLVLAAELFVPLPSGEPWNLVVLAVAVAVLCLVLAWVETLLVKMRILRVPALLGTGVATCAIGLASWLYGGGA